MREREKLTTLHLYIQYIVQRFFSIGLPRIMKYKYVYLKYAQVSLFILWEKKVYVRVTRKVDVNLSNRLKVVFTSRHWVICSQHLCYAWCRVIGEVGEFSFLFYFLYGEKTHILDLYVLCGIFLKNHILWKSAIFEMVEKFNLNQVFELRSIID